MRRIPQTVRDKIFKDWLKGDSYRKIARDNNVSISTVHMIKEEVKKKCPKIEDLRRLNILLKKSNINFYDSLRGSILLERLNSCGVSLDDLDNFVKLIETRFSENNGRNGEIIEAAIKLIDLEEKTGKPYPEVIKDYQKKSSKIPKLETKINHLKKKENAKKDQISQLKRSAEALRNGNQELRNQKIRLLDDITAFRNVRNALRAGTLHMQCKNCGWPYIELRTPTKEEYLHLIRSDKGYNVWCQNCHEMSHFHPHEIIAGLGWVLLPEEIVITRNT